MTQVPQPHDVAVLFDLDGTLVDSTYLHALCWHRAFRSRGVEVPPMWRIHRTVGMGGDKLVGHVAGEAVEREHGDELRDAWKKEYAPVDAEALALTGAASLVRELSGAGYQVVVASSGDPDFASAALDRLGINDDLTALTTSQDVEDSKPAPDIVGVALKAVDATHAVLVGDTTWDVESAGRAGIGCIALRTGGFGTDELEDAGALLVVDGVEDLRGLDWSAYVRPIGD